MALSQFEFINRAKKLHKNKFDYSLVSYQGINIKVKIICSTHGVFEQKPHDHLRKRGCQKCSLEKRIASRKISTEIFIKRANKKHNNRYDYSKATYIDTDSPLTIICHLHGEFFQSPHIHLRGAGCSICGYQTVSKKLSTDKNLFFNKASTIHKNKYDYSQTKYVRESSKIKIICPIHGFFTRTGRSHLEGYGCQKCDNYKNTRLTFEAFKDKANKKHNNKYSYKNITVIKNNREKVEILCPKHGSFIQKVLSHLNGSGCPVCGKSISKPELKWLELNRIPDDRQHRHLTIRGNGMKFFVDGYLPETKTVYEFYGDFWHGNPKKYNRNKINHATKTKFGLLYDKTIEREKNIREAGYNLITIWESDFNRYPNISFSA